MKIVVSAQGDDLDAPASPVFGRCPTFLFVDTDSMEFEAMPNPALSQSGGAGIQAAQFVVNQGAKAVLTGNLGPNAFDVLEAAGVAGYLATEGTVRQAVDAYQAGQLQSLAQANVGAHAGMGGKQPAKPAPSASQTAKQAELAELHQTLQGLRQQLAETMDRIEKLEKEA